MKEIESESSKRVDSFVNSLSSVNFVFAFAMNLFNFTILYLISISGMSVIYGGIGISVGQAILLFAVIPAGRMIDRGKSYSLMAAGSILYSIALIFVFLSTSIRVPPPDVIIALLVAFIIIFQNIFKSSLSSFIAKAVRSNKIGRSYSRIIWMESAGGTISFFLVYFAREYFSMRLLYLAVGIILLISSVASFTIFARDSRNSIKLEESRTKHPSFAESIRTMRKRGRFTTSLLASKVFMSIGVLGFSYFYLIIGKQIGAGVSLSLFMLGAASALGILWGMISEKWVSSHPEWGKIYIVVMALLDVFSYLLILVSMATDNRYLFLAAPFIGSPGPFLIPGALAFEVKVVGKENRGLFSGIQRTLTGIPAIVMGAPLAFLYAIDPVYMWSIIVASSFGTLAFSLMIPSSKSLDEDHSLADTSAL